MQILVCGAASHKEMPSVDVRRVQHPMEALPLHSSNMALFGCHDG